MIPDWITVSQVSGASGTTIVTFTAATNDTQSARTATLTVRGVNSGIEKTITINQVGVLYMNVTPSTLSVPDSGGTFTITVDTNAEEWDALTIPNWLTLSPTGGTSGQTTVTATVTSNTGSTRTGRIDFVELQGRVRGTVDVSQSGSSTGYELVITRPGSAIRNVGSDADDYNAWWEFKAVGVSNLGTVITSGTDWITRCEIEEDPTPVSGSTHLLVAYHLANTGAQREGTIQITGTTATGNVSATATLIQASGSSSTYEFRWINPSSGSRIVSSGITSANMRLRAVGVTNLGAEITSGASWLNSLTFTESALTDGTTHVATLSFNQNEGVQRTGTIHISGTTASAGNVSLIGNITQESGETPEIIITTSPRTVSYKSGSASFYYTIRGNVSGLTVSTGNASPWCTASIASGGGYIIVSYTQNNLTGSTSTRTATITISGNGGTVEDTVTLTQYGSNLSITPTTVYLDYPVNSSKSITVTSNNPWEITDIRDE